jgi:hypothetical protein
MQAKDEPVTLVYKAGITQDTGEVGMSCFCCWYVAYIGEQDWHDVPLTLETATPTFGLGVPTLNTWNIAFYRPPMVVTRSRGRARPVSIALGGQLQQQAHPSPGNALEEQMDGFTMKDYAGGMAPSLGHRHLSVASKGNVSATFQVPGMISIPSDGVVHNVTIAQLKLHATMSWVCIPKQDPKMHLKVRTLPH